MIIVLVTLALILLVCGLWIIVPMFYGPPSVPTRTDRIRKALKLANLQPNEIIYDLGAGDGRVLLIAAKEFGARAAGIEIGPIQCAVIWLRVLFSGVKGRVEIQWKDFYKANLKNADVVFAYLTSGQAKRLEAKLQKELKPSARVVTISFDFPDWQPNELDRDDLIFLYRMPPTKRSMTDS